MPRQTSNSPTNTQFVAEALAWEGVPWRHQGRTRHGVDCAGLPVVVGWELGIFPRDFDIQNYPREPDGTIKSKLLQANMLPVADYDRGERVDPATIAPGSLLLMTPQGHHLPAHLAISDARRMIHACYKRRSVIVHGFRGVFTRQVQTVYRFPGVRYE